MSKPHWKPRNVTLTGSKALNAPQKLGGEYVNPEGNKDWFADEGFELSRQGLERMLANGWQGYANGYGTKKKRQRKLTAAEVKVWMATNYAQAQEMLAELAPQPLKLAA
jgi:hypothetical protein